MDDFIDKQRGVYCRNKPDDKVKRAQLCKAPGTTASTAVCPETLRWRSHQLHISDKHIDLNIIDSDAERSSKHQASVCSYCPGNSLYKTAPVSMVSRILDLRLVN